MSITGAAGPRADARRHSRCRSRLPAFSAPWASWWRCSSARSSGEGQWVAVLSARGADRHARFPGSALAHRPSEVPGQAGNDHPTSIPTGVFPTGGRPYQHRGVRRRIWLRLCTALEADDLAEHPDYATDAARSKNRAALNKAIADVYANGRAANGSRRSTRPACLADRSIEWMRCFRDAQVAHLAMVAAVEHGMLGPLDLVRNAASLSRTPSRIQRASPERGEHTDAILAEFGFDRPRSPPCAKRASSNLLHERKRLALP